MGTEVKFEKIRLLEIYIKNLGKLISRKERVTNRRLEKKMEQIKIKLLYLRLFLSPKSMRLGAI